MQDPLAPVQQTRRRAILNPAGWRKACNHSEEEVVVRDDRIARSKTVENLQSK